MDTSPEQIWQEFSRPLRYFIKKRVTNPDDAEDILQEVFLKIHRHLNQVRDYNRIHTWIYTVAKNTIIDHYRKSSHRSEQLLAEEIPDGKDPEDMTAHREMAACLKGMVQRLPDIYREAIMLTEFENLTQVELSQRLGLSQSGAKSRVQRGRRMLKDMLLDCCRLETDRRGTVIDYEEKT